MRRAFTLLEVLVVLAILLVLAAFLTPMINRAPHSANRAECQSHLKQIGLGFLQYVQDYDERFPPARVTATIGWKDVISIYIKANDIYQWPSAANTDSSLADYFYNRRLARFHQENVDSPALTILSGDGSDDAPTWNSIPQLRAAWNATEKSPSRRHLDTANYLFADGHVKGIKFSNVKTTSPNKENYPTFALR